VQGCLELGNASDTRFDIRVYTLIQGIYAVYTRMRPETYAIGTTLRMLIGDGHMLQGAALRLLSMLSGHCEELPSAIRTVRNALQAHVPGADHTASAQAVSAFRLGMDVMNDSLLACNMAAFCGATDALHLPEVAVAPSLPPAQWQIDVMQLAIHVLEHIGAPHCQSDALPVCLSACVSASLPVSDC
jgi:hypothetical protein